VLSYRKFFLKKIRTAPCIVASVDELQFRLALLYQSGTNDAILIDSNFCLSGLHLDILARSNFVMAIHWLEAGAEYRALFHLVPVVQHISILNRALNLLPTTWDQFSFIRGDYFWQNRLISNDFPKPR
jgi:hypothetical protein